MSNYRKDPHLHIVTQSTVHYARDLLKFRTLENTLRVTDTELFTNKVSTDPTKLFEYLVKDEQKVFLGSNNENMRNIVKSIVERRPLSSINNNVDDFHFDDEDPPLVDVDVIGKQQEPQPQSTYTILSSSKGRSIPTMRHIKTNIPAAIINNRKRKLDFDAESVYSNIQDDNNGDDDYDIGVSPPTKKSKI